MTSRLQEALSAKPHLWGGWVVGPTVIGPQEYAAAGYDYVGFDVQHGYLSDADVALMLRGLEHVPVATLVRLPDAAPAPIGRVLDAGADGVIIAMVESAADAAAAVAATRYAPSGIRSFGPLRASMGIDPVALQDRVSVFAMIETTKGFAAVEEISAVDGLTGIYVGPADLAISMGHGPTEAWTKEDVFEVIRQVQRTTADAGLVSAIHANTGTAGNMLAQNDFQMITLASESQALRRGAAAHLAEARGEDS